MWGWQWEACVFCSCWIWNLACLAHLQQDLLKVNVQKGEDSQRKEGKRTGGDRMRGWLVEVAVRREGHLGAPSMGWLTASWPAFVTFWVGAAAEVCGACSLIPGPIHLFPPPAPLSSSLVYCRYKFNLQNIILFTLFEPLKSPWPKFHIWRRT